MMSDLIQWPRAQYWDKPWNPIVGCRPCSPACENCYAAAMMRRFGAANFSPRVTTRVNPPRKGVVFCGNMTDLFGEWCDGVIPPEYCIRQAIGKTHNDATYLWLTKRVGRMRIALQNSFATEWGKTRRYCHYFGFTAENQEWYNRRQQESLALPTWAKMWYSLEPLLGPIQLGAGAVRNSLRWIVVGGESGPNRRPCKIEWVESIVDQCRSAGVPVFVKQLDLNGKCERDISKFPAHLQIRQVPWAKEGGNNAD